MCTCEFKAAAVLPAPLQPTLCMERIALLPTSPCSRRFNRLVRSRVVANHHRSVICGGSVLQDFQDSRSWDPLHHHSLASLFRATFHILIKLKLCLISTWHDPVLRSESFPASLLQTSVPGRRAACLHVCRVTVRLSALTPGCDREPFKTHQHLTASCSRSLTYVCMTVRAGTNNHQILFVVAEPEEGKVSRSRFERVDSGGERRLCAPLFLL